jgi:hypothetical protein
MSLILQGSTSGSVTLQEPAVAGTTVIDLPATSGTLVVTGGAQTIEFAAGSASTPSITTTGDTNTGIFFPAADTFATSTGGTERMRIDSSGNLLVGKTSTSSVNSGVQINGGATGSMTLGTTGTSGTSQVEFFRGTSGSLTRVGFIETTGSATTYNTSSDYRLKENIAPMTGALATVTALKPCTYKWKLDGKDGQGFIAHELQAIVPDAVSGEKDAVETYTDKDGNEQTRIKPQGVDTSFLVATLTSAIQELNVKVEAQAVRIAELEGVA